MVNVAGGVCFRPGHRARLVYRLHVYHGRAGEPKTFAGRDYCDLIITVHRQLEAPLVWCRDNLSRRLTEEPADFAEANSAWRRVFQLPARAPVLNPVEGVWSLLRRAMANCVVADLPALVRILRHKLTGIHTARTCSTAVSPAWMWPGSAAAGRSGGARRR
ncbi:DDE endonuclease [Streptomyces griseorubiginosus]|uniref:DDE endonuclease n=1 Tax=Streptomyces griseorubiginosus TaxID=67304 RepID=UPI001AD74744|nr:DDE endonuclease [Streptomyces griseorubiginosus]